MFTNNIQVKYAALHNFTTIGETSPVYTDDREPLKNERFLENIKGKLYGDKGYHSKELTNILFVNGLHLVTSIRNNIKNVLMEMKDKIMFRKRSVIETINDELKNMCQVEHSSFIAPLETS